MFIVTGATGQVGSAIVNKLLEQDKPVTAVIRNAGKAEKLKKRGAKTAIADFFNQDALSKAFDGGDTVFLLTPENPASKDILGDTKQILSNYRQAIRKAGISRIIGLSSLGAQHKSGTGNLVMSYMLEHAFENVSAETTFIRPAYYYSNWLMYVEMARESGVLPTFFPVDLSIPMISPGDVSHFIANVMMDEKKDQKIYELAGPEVYTPREVADIFGNLLGKKIKTQQIPREQWSETLVQAGFSTDAADKMIQMTQAVIDGKAQPEKSGLKKLPTTLGDFLKERIN